MAARHVDVEEADIAQPTNSFEDGLERTWSAVLEHDVATMQEAQELDRQRQLRRMRMLASDHAGTVRRGVVRFVVVVVDLSRYMLEKDQLRSTRLEVLRRHFQAFVTEFFDQNPISQLSVMVTKNQKAFRRTELSGHPSMHHDCIGPHEACKGVASFQNAIEQAVQTLSHVPAHGSREIIIITGSLSTWDPGDIFDTARKAAENKVRVSAVSLAAEIYVLRKVAELTNGVFRVALGEEHFRSLLMYHLAPPPSVASVRPEAALVRMAFPQRITETTPTFCVCHLKLTTEGYLCPRCGGKNCELPCDCACCGTTQILSSHLARSYHHLFPVPDFDDVPLGDRPASTVACTACQFSIHASQLCARCPLCRGLFCADCDLFIHDTLHNCPGCESRTSDSDAANAARDADGDVAMARGAAT